MFETKMEKEHTHKVSGDPYKHVSIGFVGIAGGALVLAIFIGAFMVANNKHVALRPQITEASWANNSATGCAVLKNPFDRARCQGAGGSGGTGGSDSSGKAPACNPSVKVTAASPIYGQGRSFTFRVDASAAANCLIESISYEGDTETFSGTAGPLRASFYASASGTVGTCKVLRVTISGRQLTSTGIMQGRFTGSGSTSIGIVSKTAPPATPNPCTAQ